jgi:hypothetical protein
MKSSSVKSAMEAAFRGLERKLGIDREGRSVWVWLLPPAIGFVTAVLVPFMPGLPDEMGLADRLTLAVFAFLTMTTIASIYLISFDNDHNQQAPADDPPGRGRSDGPEQPPAPSGSPPPKWVRDLDAVKVRRAPDPDEDGAERKVPALSGADR